MTGIVKTATGSNSRAEKKARATKTSPADVVSQSFTQLLPVLTIWNAMQISWSGCKDSQTSADTVEAGQSTGAMSYVSRLMRVTLSAYTHLPCRPLSLF